MRRRILVSALWGLMCSAPMAQEAIGQGAIPRDTSYTVYQSLLKVRKAYPDAAPALPVLPEGVTAERSIAYAVLDSTVWGPRTLHLDLFHPRKAGSYPAVVMVHGGGWRSGDRSMQHPLAMQLARLFMQLCLQNDNVNFADNGRERKSSELQLRGF